MLSNITFKTNLKMEKIEETIITIEEFIIYRTKELNKKEYEEVLRELISNLEIMLDTSEID